MWKNVIAVLILISTTSAYRAQYGSAEGGYYPHNYHGTIFTGTVTSTNDDTREVTLSYTNPKNGKVQTFVGVLEEGYLVKHKGGSPYELKPSEIKHGMLIKVYFVPMTRKVGGKKTTINTILLMSGIPNLRAEDVSFQAF